jgi:hypothetical protein
MMLGEITGAGQRIFSIMVASPERAEKGARTDVF